MKRGSYFLFTAMREAEGYYKRKGGNPLTAASHNDNGTGLDNLTELFRTSSKKHYLSSLYFFTFLLSLRSLTA